MIRKLRRLNPHHRARREAFVRALVSASHDDAALGYPLSPSVFRQVEDELNAIWRSKGRFSHEDVTAVLEASRFGPMVKREILSRLSV